MSTHICTYLIVEPQLLLAYSPALDVEQAEGKASIYPTDSECQADNECQAMHSDRFPGDLSTVWCNKCSKGIIPGSVCNFYVSEYTREDGFNLDDRANEELDKVLAETEPSSPAKYWPGVSYTSAIGEGASLASNQLANIIVGKQEHAIAPADKPIAGTSGIIYSEEAIVVAKKHNRGPAQELAYNAAKKRVSRRLLLAERAKYLTVNCPVTGITTLLQIPAIPGQTLIWDSPLADYNNCRGIAQQGTRYLVNLDTQILAGVLIVLADTYSLFKFQPYDSGAQKNAILRTGGKENIIDAIIMIESLVHSANCSFLPTLSLVFDSNLEEFGLSVRLRSYLTKLAEAISKPDKEAYDENKKPKKIGRPLYIKDVEAKANKISFLARAELSAAEKLFKEDKKAAKIAILELSKANLISIKFKGFLLSVVNEDSLLVITIEMKNLICDKLEFVGSIYAKNLAAIIKKDRAILSLDIGEIEESITVAADNEEADNDEEIDEDNQGDNDENEDNEASKENNVLMCGLLNSEANNRRDKLGSNDAPDKSKIQTSTETKELSFVERLLLKKKQETIARNIVQNDIPSIVEYVPSAAKINLGKEQKS